MKREPLDRALARKQALLPAAELHKRWWHPRPKSSGSMRSQRPVAGPSPRERFTASLERSRRETACQGGPGAREARGISLYPPFGGPGRRRRMHGKLRTPAWEHFVCEYRGYLRAAASAVLRCSSASPEACYLADSLFADLYGLTDGARRERSLFRYFHGRSSLKTWLRAVLAQRHIDAIRAGRRFESLDDDEAKPTAQIIPLTVSVQPADPNRERYSCSFLCARLASCSRRSRSAP